MDIIALLAAGYILGSMPFGLWIVKAWRGIDIREHGSGNIGATNVMRTAGAGPAIVVFLMDLAKGFIPVAVARWLFPEMPWIAVAGAMSAILGHTASVFLRFRGGKGAATGLGVIFGLDPCIAGMGFGIWLVIVALTRYVSVASILASASIPVLFYVFQLPFAFRVFGIAAAVFVIVKHRSNMVRLMQRKEHRWGERV